VRNVPVSIVIPVYNGREMLAELFASINRQTTEPQEVIVVDNGSSDGAPELAFRAGAKVIAMGRNMGFAAAVNRGIQDAKGQGVALLNSDVRLDAGWLETLWTSLRENNADFATGTILRAGSDRILDGSYDLVCRGGCAWRAGSGMSRAVLGDAPRPIQFCSGTAGLFRTQLFREVGMFEERFESYLEDVDFGLRCAAAGRTGIYCPAAVCWHRGSATFGAWHPRVVRLLSRNQVWLVARHYPATLILRWLWPILTAQFLWGGLALRHGCGTAWLRGKFEGLWKFHDLSGVSPSVESAIADSERQIVDIQTRGGFDRYWKTYFLVARSLR
jgi:GT2 family glycosyltransferase